MRHLCSLLLYLSSHLAELLVPQLSWPTIPPLARVEEQTADIVLAGGVSCTYRHEYELSSRQATEWYAYDQGQVV